MRSAAIVVPIGSASERLRRVADDFLVRELDRRDQRGALADLAHERVARERAGDLAVLMPAHAVGDEPQAEIGVGVVGVFVMFAAQADVGAVSELDHALRE